MRFHFNIEISPALFNAFDRVSSCIGILVPVIGLVVFGLVVK